MRYLLALVILLYSNITQSQTFSWKVLPLPKVSDRYNDVWFITPDLGWAIVPSDGGTKPDGFIYKTTDGGATWTTQYATTQHLRSVCFLDERIGFVGVLFDGSASPLLRTTDGGETWTRADIEGSMPTGICGLMRVNDSTIVGSGQVYGPAHFIRTTDRGATWASIALGTEDDWAIDCYFWSTDSGIVAGGSKASGQPMVSHIWQTTDGGANWTDSYVGQPDSPVDGEWCWKISFPSREVGYISIEQDRGNSRILKTTDRGVTWQRIVIPQAGSRLQGCGFITDLHGWIGGRSFGAYVTEDGGLTWSSTKDIQFVNRFRFFGDSLGYVAGDRVYKLTSTAAVAEDLSTTSRSMLYDAAHTSLVVTSSGAQRTLTVSNILGREVMRKQVLSEREMIDVRDLPHGTYFARTDNEQALKFSR
jgi:photosystem II stability/assembly factor-like uncharacterized protein